MLRSLELLPVYDSAEHDLIRDLQVPLLQRSIDYLRGVGFFTSGWLRIAQRGMADFVQRGGKARIVLSPILEEADWEALKMGEEARFDIGLRSVLAKRVADISASLEQDTLNALAWMVADEILEIRFAIPRIREHMGIYHDKIGIFKDECDDIVALHGSLNDSLQGSLNGEAFSVFTSWDLGQRPYLDKHVTRLEALWCDHNSQFKVCLIPDAIREGFIRLRVTTTRPYKLPTQPGGMAFRSDPECPVTLYPYQEEAITRWKEADCRGVFEMATGTGKTITSLAAAVDRYKSIGRLALIILVPYLHLLEQWGRICRDFGFSPILCSGDHGRWQIEVKSKVQDFSIGSIDNLCILAVHMTATLPRFHDSIAGLTPNLTMLVGDEAHALGAPQLQKALAPIASLRLGLSATPRRWYDDEGTKVIFDYFGETCFELSLDDAIGKYLTTYRYYPQLVSLNDAEVERYSALTAKVLALHPQAERDANVREHVKMLLLQRARIVSSAAAKLPAMLELLRKCIAQEKQKSAELKGVLIYCAPGTHREVLQAVASLGLRCHEFVYDVSLSRRESLLDQFAQGDIQALIAIRCLDEGVDVPSTHTAFIMASSTNPREFVQRRGRILRRAAGKAEAIIYDYLVVPLADGAVAREDADQSVLRREMPRFAEFASSAKNEFQARAVVRDILDNCGMLNCLDDKPWDIYRSLKQWDWSNDE